MSRTTSPEMRPRPRPGVSTPPAAGSLALSAWCVTAAFGTYFCMYGFRKPFTAGSYSGMAAWGVGYKTILVVSQVLGYTTSKFIGVRVIASMRPERRVVVLLGLIGLAQLALLLFALVPPPLGAACLFLNGLPLGMVFGLVLGFLEGRKLTEALTAGLCASFILADGLTRSVGLGCWTGASRSRGCRSRPGWCSRARSWGSPGCWAGSRRRASTTWPAGASVGRWIGPIGGRSSSGMPSGSR